MRGGLGRVGSSTGHATEVDGSLSTILDNGRLPSGPNVVVAPGDGQASTGGQDRWLPGLLAIGDLLVLTTTWLSIAALAHHLWGEGGSWLLVRSIPVICAGLVLLAASHLYRPSVGTTPWVEVAKLARVAAGCGAIAFLVSLVPRHDPWAAVVSAAVTFGLLVLYHASYWAWVRALHRRGKCLRDVLIVASPRDAHVIRAHLRNFPEIGYRVAGMVSPVPWLPAPEGAPSGVVGEIIDIARDLEATDLLIAPSALPSTQLSQLTRSALTLGFPMQVWGGVPGIDPHRIRPFPLGHQAAFAVEPHRMSTTALLVKRFVDVICSTLLLVVTAPILLAAALWIKLEDGGPVIFRQTRIGKDGRRFQLFKLRSMVVDAEARLAEIRHRNERLDSPLFKLEADPRVTRAGRFLRATSIDELPQLFNVLRGDMTLVGPRPALAEEVASFDEELLRRLRVTPGVTGLWQVKARENPSFEVYRDLDLFYVENWSLSMDLAILASTAASVLVRAVRQLRSDQPTTAEPGSTTSDPHSSHAVRSNALTGVVE